MARQRFNNKQLDLFCTLVGINSAIGYVLYTVTPVANHSYIQHSWSKRLDSILDFLKQLITSPQTLLVLILIVVLTWFLTVRKSKNYLSYNFHKQCASLKIDKEAFGFYIVFTLTSTIICIIFTVITYGIFEDFYHFRYIQALAFCPPVLIGISLKLAAQTIKERVAIRRHLNYFITPILALMITLDLALIPQFWQEYTPQKNIYVQNFACLHELGIDYYAAEYWWAKPIHVLSGGEIKPIQLNSHADYYQWINSERWNQDLNQLDGTLGVLVEADGEQLIDSKQVIRKTSAFIPKQCGTLKYLLSAD